ncbi:hypothetical protein D3C75_1212290 [compost metagenome]
MVVPGIALIGRKLALGTRAPHLDQATRLVGVGTIDEQSDRVIAIDLIGFHIPLKLAFDASQVRRRTSFRGPGRISMALTHIGVMCAACHE